MTTQINADAQIRGTLSGQTISANASASTYCDSLFVEEGNPITIATGVTLTIDVSFKAGLYKAFNCVGTGKVVFAVGSVSEIYPQWWGALPTASAAINTAAIRAAVVSPAVSSFGSGVIMAGQILIGNVPWIVLPDGLYEINDNIPYSYYTQVKSDHGIIYQNDPTKDIFYSQAIYRNEFRGVGFVGGKTQIYAQNGTVGGIESVMVIVADCDFQTSASYAVQFLKSGAAGGEQGIIKDCKFFNFAQVLDTRFDFTSMRDCWLETDNTFQTADSAWIRSVACAVSDTVFIPGGTYSTPGMTTRYFDNYTSTSLTRCRFGSEGGGGMPIVYNFSSAIGIGDVYPYQMGGKVSIIDCFPTAAGSRADAGYIVLKTGIPKVINIEGNQYSFDGPYIRTDLIAGIGGFAAYMAAAVAITQPEIAIRIRNNPGWAKSFTDSAASNALLRPWTEFDTVTPQGTQLSLPPVLRLPGAGYWQTSISPAAPNDTISIVDTEIAVSATSEGSAYLVTVTANPNLAGSANNIDTIVGVVTITTAGAVISIAGTYIKAGTVLTMTPAIVATVLNPTGQLRLSIGNFTAGQAGNYETVQVIRLI